MRQITWTNYACILTIVTQFFQDRIKFTVISIKMAQDHWLPANMGLLSASKFHGLRDLSFD